MKFMTKFLLSILVLWLAFFIASATAYKLPKEPMVIHESSDYMGDYVGDMYVYTLTEDGIQIKFRNNTKYMIMNNTLFVDTFDSSGNRIHRSKFGFMRYDGFYEIHVANGVYTKLRE